MELEGIRFFHSFVLPDGRRIAGDKSLKILQNEEAHHFRHGVAGRSVLDVGAWNGYFSFAAERHGAARVLATDHFCWSGPGWGTKAEFDFIHGELGSRVESLDIDVFDLDPSKLGTFNTVLFLGVLYHLKDPFGGLEKAAAMSNDHIVVETACDMISRPEPLMRYYLGNELNSDGSNYWAPNLPCLTNMLRELGFKRFEHEYWGVEGERGRLRMHAWR